MSITINNFIFISPTVSSNNYWLISENSFCSKRFFPFESTNKNSTCKIISTFGVHPENAEKYSNQLWMLDDALNQSKNDW